MSFQYYNAALLDLAIALVEQLLLKGHLHDLVIALVEQLLKGHLHDLGGAAIKGPPS